MKILAVARSIPSPTWGGGLRNYHLLKALAAEHVVSLLAPAADADGGGSQERTDYFTGSVTNFAPPSTPPRRLHQLVTIARGRSYALVGQSVAGLPAALESLLARERYDAVLFDSIFTADFGPEPRERLDAKIIINQHNIEHELLQRSGESQRAPLRRWFYRRESRALRPVEVHRCGQADLVLVASERERNVLAPLLPDTRIVVVPNGVDVAAFQPVPGGSEVPGRLIFTGSMDYYPNVQAVLFFAQECWAHIRAAMPGATWQIVGRNPPTAVQRLNGHQGVSVFGTVPDMRPYLAAAEVAIVPLLSGSGTRLKILEAFAMGKAVVSTSLGCEGLSVRHGEHIVLADEPLAFASAVVKLLGDADGRAALGAAGRARAESDFSWDRCGAALLAAVEQLHERRQAHVPVAGAQVAPHSG